MDETSSVANSTQEVEVTHQLEATLHRLGVCGACGQLTLLADDDTCLRCSSCVARADSREVRAELETK